MKFSEVVEQVLAMLQRQGRISYRALTLDNEYIEDLKEEIIKARRLAIDEDGSVLVWIGDGINGDKDKRITGEIAKRGNSETGEDAERRTPN